MLILSKRTLANDNGVCRRVEELWRIDKFQPRTLKPPSRLCRVAEKPHLALVFRVLRDSGPYAEPRAIRESFRHRLKTPSIVAVDARTAIPNCHISSLHPRRRIRP